MESTLRPKHFAICGRTPEGWQTAVAVKVASRTDACALMEKYITSHQGAFSAYRVDDISENWFNTLEKGGTVLCLVSNYVTLMLKRQMLQGAP